MPTASQAESASSILVTRSTKKAQVIDPGLFAVLADHSPRAGSVPDGRSSGSPAVSAQRAPALQGAAAHAFSALRRGCPAMSSPVSSTSGVRIVTRPECCRAVAHDMASMACLWPCSPAARSKAAADCATVRVTQTPAPRCERAGRHDAGGRLLWLSPALPGRTHDLTAARTHLIIRICERQGVPVLADLAHQGADPWLTTGIERRPLQELTPAEKSRDQAPAAARAPVERGVARLKSWRIFRRPRCSPNRMTSIAKAVLTLERQW